MPDNLTFSEQIIQIRQQVAVPTACEVLAEEAIELAHAALKLARILRDESPTPVTFDEALSNLIEEASDVELSSRVLGQKLGVTLISDKVVCKKTERWLERLVERAQSDKSE